MHWIRTASVHAWALMALLLCVPASASAATAPTLRAPEANAPAATEGASLEFEWSGALQGDPDALSRSFFRLEIIKASEVPAGAQTAWTNVENYFPTTPGQAETSATLGVPSAGEYRWRVCAWGVLDDSVDNVIQQLPGGCSASRTITTVAATTTTQSIGELKMEQRNQVAGTTRTVVVRRQAPAQPTVEEPAPVVEPVVEDVPPAGFTDVKDRAEVGGGDSAVGLPTEGLDSASAAGRDGLGGALLGGLSATLPFVPIPFWTLALLLACFPILRQWRRSVLAMFDWSDGSIDGRGTASSMSGELAPVLVAQDVKDASMTADGTAAAPAPVVSPSAPERGRRAA